ncbi:MAG: RDD family protein [Microthrixaceae bacterium]
MKANADPQLAVTLQGHYAGAVTRLAAFAIDQAVATSAFALGSAIVSWVLHLVTGGELTWNPSPWITGLLFFFWLFLYYAYPWSVSGKTFGMAVLGIRVVRADGAPATPRNGVLRTLALPLSFLTLGIGFVPIITGRHRRALHDMIAGTAVVYAWDARAARLRFLARHQPTE